MKGYVSRSISERLERGLGPDDGQPARPVTSTIACSLGRLRLEGVTSAPASTPCLPHDCGAHGRNSRTVTGQRDASCAATGASRPPALLAARQAGVVRADNGPHGLIPAASW